MKKHFESLEFYTYIIIIMILVYKISTMIAKHDMENSMIYNRPDSVEIFSEPEVTELIVPESIMITMNWWIDEMRSLEKWTPKMEERAKSITSIRMLYYKDMELVNGQKPLAVTKFHVVDGVLLPYEIVFSYNIMFEELGMVSVIFHELGHAILLLDDITEKPEINMDEIMWYRGSTTYYKLSDIEFFNEKFNNLINSPEDTELINNMINMYNEGAKMSYTCGLVH